MGVVTDRQGRDSRADDPVTQAVWKRERRIAYPRPEKDDAAAKPAAEAPPAEEVRNNPAA